MRNFTDPKDPLIVKTLRYLDRWTHTTEVILEREGLCSRAGCQCIAAALVCNNFDYPYFDSLISAWYAPSCYANCGCRHERLPAVSRENGTVNVGLNIPNSTTSVAEDWLAGQQAGR